MSADAPRRARFFETARAALPPSRLVYPPDLARIVADRRRLAGMRRARP